MHSRLSASAFYFLYFGAASGILPYLNLFYQAIGLDTWHIGILAALLLVGQLIAGPLWGVLADALHLHGRLLPLAMLATLPPVFLLIGAQSFAVLVVLIIWLAVCFAPIVPLADNAVLAMLGDKRGNYGKLRLWGAVGWGLTAWATGYLVEGFGPQAGFVSFLTLMSIGALISTRLPAPPPIPIASFTQNARPFLTNRRWLGFLVSIFLVGLGLAVQNNYFPLYFKAVGGSGSQFGLSLAASSLSELPIFFLSPLLLTRLKADGLFKAAALVLIVRCFLYTVAPNPDWLILIQLLHGPSFSALWVAAVSYASATAPEGLGASAQALLAATFYSLSGTIGALLGSQIYAASGPAALFGAAGTAGIVGLLIFTIRERARRNLPTAPL